MPPHLRNYTNIAGITEDYFKVREFLLRLGYSEFVYARWDWMITHGYLDKTAVGKIGIWEENGEIVGIATFDTRLGVGYCLTHPDYWGLKEEMLNYAKEKGDFNKEKNSYTIEEKHAQFGFKLPAGFLN